MYMRWNSEEERKFWNEKIQIKSQKCILIYFIALTPVAAVHIGKKREWIS